MAYRAMSGYMAGAGHMHYGPGTSMVQFTRPVAQYDGMGCACGCGTCNDKCGMGIFESGADISGWGLPEWGIVLLGGYMLFSTVFTTRTAASNVRQRVRRGRRRLGARIAGA